MGIQVITSEATYLESIYLLTSVFFQNLHPVITTLEQNRLFSNIFVIERCSEKLLERLIERKESTVFNGICDILCDFLENDCDPFVTYSKNQTYQEREFVQLKLVNSTFVNILRKIEAIGECKGRNFHSFLILPVQRIMRYRILIEAIRNKIVDQESHEFMMATRAIQLACQASYYRAPNIRGIIRLMYLIGKK